MLLYVICYNIIHMIYLLAHTYTCINRLTCMFIYECACNLLTFSSELHEAFRQTETVLLFWLLLRYQRLFMLGCMYSWLSSIERSRKECKH